MYKDDEIGYYEISKFPKARIPTLDFLTLGDNTHYVKGLFEIDVTEARQKILKNEQYANMKISFTAWLLKCIGQAAYEYKEVHSMMFGKKKVIKFDDVDISITVERNIKGIKAPMPLVIRKTNTKTIIQIHNEIRAAQSEKVARATILGGHKLDKKMKKYLILPKTLRRFLIKRTLNTPFKVKRVMGTIIVTAVGMFGNAYGWSIPTTTHPLAFGIGRITKKPGIIDDKIEIRNYLPMTVLFNHDVVDGAPATRFIARLVELIENSFGLENMVFQ